MDRKTLSILLFATLLFSCDKTTQEKEDPVSPQETVVPVSSVTLSKTDLTLVEGEEETLVATVKPDNATDKSVVWESSDVKVASVSNEGKVAAVSEGSAVITAKSGTAFATCQLKVNPKQMEILGLETLQSTAFRVDESVDLVQGLSVTRGGTITKILVKEDGVETELNSHVYAPEFPVESLAFTFLAESPDGKQNATATVEGLTVLPLEYNQVALTPTNLGTNWDEWKKVSRGNREWYKFYETVGLLQTKKVLEQLDLMAPMGRKEKLEHIKLVGAGESPTGDYPWIEGVWETAPSSYPYTLQTQHSDIMTEKIKTSDNAANKGIAQSYPGRILWTTGLDWYWADLLTYAKERPDTKYIFFTANDWVGGMGEQWNPKGTKEGDALQELVNAQNTFVIVAISNIHDDRDFALECNQPWIERAKYNSTSIQGKHSIAAIGGNLTETKFRDYEYYPYEHSVFPIGYEQKNLKISSGGYPAHESTEELSLGAWSNEASSWPTAELAATMWNIMALNPDMSFDDLMDLINTYKILIPASHNGEKIQDFDTPDQKEICRQICLPKLPEGLSSDACSELPRDSKYPAVLWTGSGVEYNIGGEWKSLTAGDFQDGRDIFEAASNATFRFNPVLWKKMGGKGTVNLKVMAITTDGETIPEVEREVSYSL